MATPDGKSAGGRVTPVSTGVMARVIGAAQGAWNGWFGPGQPLSPTAPKDQAAGRQFDYPYGVNMAFGPRGESGQAAISFATLRMFADPSQGGLDLVRLAIETRKNQMAAQRWAIRGRGEQDDGGKKARDLEVALRRPDGVLTFRSWMRSVLEDHYVIDAPTIYYGASIKNRPLLEIMDGATIKLLIDEGGRSPQPPLPAYQQFLHGLPAVDYTREEIGYYLFNPRPNRIYGMSHVEQIVGIIAIALNRQLSVLDYFTQGTVPDVFIKVPETWNVDVIKSGAAVVRLAARRAARRAAEGALHPRRRGRRSSRKIRSSRTNSTSGSRGSSATRSRSRRRRSSSRRTARQRTPRRSRRRKKASSRRSSGSRT
jgi:hypothetical protein